MEHIIEVEDLRKSYGDVHAVKGISFYVEPGKLFALLGPNGAGKSTTIDTICTFLKPDSGCLTVNGYVLGKQDNKIRKTIGAVFQDSLLDRLLTVEENLRCRGAFYGLRGKALNDAVKNAMTSVGVADYADRKYGTLSGGQRRRCDIARALVNAPKILFLDEPTTGLDPQTRKVVWETIRRLQQERGMTIFLTTHYMEEATAADYVIVVDDGRISAKGTPSQLREQYASDKLRLTCTDFDAVGAVLDKAGMQYIRESNQLVSNISKSMDAIPVLTQCATLISAFEVTAGTMDDAFIGITGKELRQ